ncbi:hypothetical protein NQ314_020092 [Rhamnusium bicolor]|uniref:Uncharacterized protein n=1 Tax=Rhamnusium bicolor TaxID=1586634 RepID=A0AAV8WLF7_9CUCU|nr:hypothetical protein NQ314_020092 [Rhamnusium bicolor]
MEGTNLGRAKTFDQKDVEKLINEALDEVFLLMKVVTVVGVMDTCRCDELLNLKTTAIEDNGSVSVINVLNL